MRVALFAGPANLEAAGRGLLLANALDSTDPNVTRVVVGAGLGPENWNLRHGEAWGPLAPMVVATIPRGGEPALVPLTEYHPAAEVVFAAFGPPPPDWLRTIRVLLLPPVELQHAPGDDIHIRRRKGRIGCPLSWSTGWGYLTAGHAAPFAGTAVTNAYGGAAGMVRWSQAPPGPSGAITSDLAIIELSPSLPPMPGGASAVTPPANSAVTIHGVGGDQVVALVVWYFMPSVGGTYDQLYFTAHGYTTPGDSGAAVTLAGPGGAVGIVVGGVPGFVTMIQDAGFLIGQAAASGLAGLRF